ncbi:hypothetical protein D3C74_210880 [compost metagenome]
MVLSSGQIERWAVDAIQIAANQPGCFLVPDIPVGDKGISFDGNISVFIDASEKKESLIGIVPVQVKGTEVTRFHKHKRTYSLDLVHYRNYLNRDGVLLFVVELKANGEKRIFYKSLLSMELNQITKKYSHQKTKSIELRSLEETNLYAVCTKFLMEQKHQPRMLVEKQVFSPESFQEFRLSSLTFNAQNPKDSIFDHDFNVYGVINQTPIPYKIGRIGSITGREVTKLNINGRKYSLKAKLLFEKEKTTIVIEEVVTFVINETVNKFDFNFMGFKSLATQLDIVPIVIDFFSGHPLEFEEHGVAFKINETITSDDIQELQLYQQNLQDMAIAYEHLGIPVDTSFGSSDDTDIYSELLSITKTANEDSLNGLTIKNPDGALMLNIKVGDKSIVVFYNPKGDRLLINGFSEETLKIDCIIHLEKEDNGFPHSIYTLLREDALANSVNIDIDIIKKSFDGLELFSDDVFEWTNQFCLRCLQAYDINRNMKILDLANYIYDKYLTDLSAADCSNPLDIIVLINRLQINKRINGALDETMKQKLVQLKYESTTSNKSDLLFCVNVLLEIKFEADLCFRQLKPEAQDFYKILPIYKLYQEL